MKYFFAFLLLIASTTGITYGQQTPATKTITGYKVIKPEQVPVPGIATTSPNSPQDLPVTYTFTGNGDWNDPANWENNLVFEAIWAKWSTLPLPLSLRTIASEKQFEQSLLTRNKGR